MTKARDKPGPEAIFQQFAHVAAQRGASQDTCSALSDAAMALNRLTGQKNWREVDEIDEKLRDLSTLAPTPVANLIGGLRTITIDKSFRFILSYAAFLLLLTPFASYLLVVFLRIGSLGNPNLFQSEEFKDLVRGVVSAALYLPLFLVNRLNKTHRCPTVRPGLLPVLIGLALIATFEYLCGTFYFLSPDDFSVTAFWEHMYLSARTRWLYPLPFVVIGINLMTAARFIRLSKETSELLDNELGVYLRFAVIAIIAIGISAFIRVGLGLIDYSAKTTGEPTARAASAPREVFTTSKLNLRTCPSTTNCRIVQTLSEGTRLDVVSEEGEWLQVRITEDQTRVGWVSVHYTRPVELDLPERPRRNETVLVPGEHRFFISYICFDADCRKLKMIREEGVFLVEPTKLTLTSESLGVIATLKVSEWQVVRCEPASTEFMALEFKKYDGNERFVFIGGGNFDPLLKALAQISG